MQSKNTKLTLDPSFSCSAISFDDDIKKKGNYYRGITSTTSTFTLNHTLPQQDIAYIKQKNNKSSSDLNNTVPSYDFNLNNMYLPKSKAKAPHIQEQQTLDIIMTPIHIENDDDYLSPSTLTPTSITSSFNYCNDFNSFLINNTDTDSILNKLNNILHNYNKSDKSDIDIDYKIDYKNKCIYDGIVFISSHYVFYNMYIWTEHNQSRCEFRRQSGDALAAAKFYADIKNLYNDVHATDDDDDDAFNFVSFDLDLNGLALPPLDNDNDDNKSNLVDLDDINESLINNDEFVVDELNILYESLDYNNNNNYDDVLSHHDLIQNLINYGLINKDLCVVRISLLILNKINIDINQIQLYNHINILLNHKYKLIQKYALRLLNKLSLLYIKWNVDISSKNQMIKNIRRIENELKDDILYKQMIKQIYQKLIIQ